MIRRVGARLAGVQNGADLGIDTRVDEAGVGRDRVFDPGAAGEAERASRKRRAGSGVPVIVAEVGEAVNDELISAVGTILAWIGVADSWSRSASPLSSERRIARNFPSCHWMTFDASLGSSRRTIRVLSRSWLANASSDGTSSGCVRPGSRTSTARA